MGDVHGWTQSQKPMLGSRSHWMCNFGVGAEHGWTQSQTPTVGSRCRTKMKIIPTRISRQSPHMTIEFSEKSTNLAHMWVHITKIST